MSAVTTRVAGDAAAAGDVRLGPLERHLRAAGRKLLVPYTTGGLTGAWTDVLSAYAAAGADAIEVGLPFSDPMIDGPTIQAASDRALTRGATVASVLDDVRGLHVGVPLVAMTYANLAHRPSPQVFCDRLRAAGFAGLIVADLPVGESLEMERAALDAGLDLVLLAAPSSPPQRLDEVVRRSRGFVYAVSVMGTTGARARLAGSAQALAASLRVRTDRPVLLGLGISTPGQAVQAAQAADGIVIGSSLVRQLLDGADPTSVGGWLATVRAALDREHPGEHTAAARPQVPDDRG